MYYYRNKYFLAKFLTSWICMLVYWTFKTIIDLICLLIKVSSSSSNRIGLLTNGSFLANDVIILQMFWLYEWRPCSKRLGHYVKVAVLVQTILYICGCTNKHSALLQSTFLVLMNLHCTRKIKNHVRHLYLGYFLEPLLGAF